MENSQPAKSTIGQRIKKLRIEKGLTQEALARKAEISYATLVKIEGDAVENPSINTVKRIAVGLEISVDELIS